MPRKYIHPLSELTKILYSGAKESVVSELQTKVVQAKRCLEDLADLHFKAHERIKQDLLALRDSVVSELDKFFQEQETVLVSTLESMNSSVLSELEDSVETFQAEIETILRTESVDSKSIVIGLTASFDDPKYFEKTCYDYIENWFILKKRIAESESIKYHSELLTKLEPVESKRD